MNMSNGSRLPAVLVVCSFLIASSVIVLSARDNAEDGLSRFLPAFHSEQELSSFVHDSVSGHYLEDASYGSSEVRLALGSKGAVHSETNIQVAGVDEADVVKTDGKFIYIASSDRVTVVEAFPVSELSNVSCIHSDDLTDTMVGDAHANVWGLFVTQSDLIIIWTWSEQQRQFLDLEAGVKVASASTGPVTAVSVVDLSDIKDPKIERSFGVSGYPMSARMIGDVVYVIAQQSVWWNEEVGMPQVWTGSDHGDISVDRIHYDPETSDASSFVNVLSIDTSAGASDYESILSGWSSTVYMSESALYLTFPKWNWSTVQMLSDEDTGHTTIYKLVVNGMEMSAAARGEVAGYLNDQYSMDERDGFLRVTTTNSWASRACNVFVLNESLSVAGSLRSIAPGETVTASRFVGDTLYLVTFRSIDPLFVIDLRDPARPSVMGELTIPGFSSYLHPVDANHILGIGTENGSAKFSLFDVGNPFAPIEESRYVVPGNSWTDASWDPKAVLFDAEKELLVVPIHSNSYDQGYSYISENYAGIFTVSAENGIELRGTIPHWQGTGSYYDTNYGYYCYFDYSVSRSLYISDCLYTISQTMVKANSLSDLSPMGSLVYNAPSHPIPDPNAVYDTNRSV